MGNKSGQDVRPGMEWGPLTYLAERLGENADIEAFFWRGQTFASTEVVNLVETHHRQLEASGIGPDDVVVLQGDYSPTTVGLLLALIATRAIVVPLLPATVARHPALVDIADPSFVIDASTRLKAEITQRTEGSTSNEHYEELRRRGAPGLVLFTSGSTGQPKGVVHDFGLLLKKFHVQRARMVSLNFLLFDHWGGLNTLLHCLSNGSPVVLPETRSPEYICELIEKHRVELLPATPTFLNLLLISHAYKRRDVTSLKLITYGAEPMPDATLKGVRRIFPGVEARQTYGLIELGVLRTKSRSSDSLWVKMGGEGYDIRVVDGLLEIKAESAMLGYLNAPSPFTEDGYFMTGDQVEVDGEYLRVLGRESELINVGGDKVYPAEVETTILECEFVQDAVVYGESNPITGHIVCADVRLTGGEDEKAARSEIKRHCRSRLSPFKVPVKIKFVSEQLHGDRYKRMRRR